MLLTLLGPSATATRSQSQLLNTTFAPSDLAHALTTQQETSSRLAVGFITVVAVVSKQLPLRPSVHSLSLSLTEYKALMLQLFYSLPQMFVVELASSPTDALAFVLSRLCRLQGPALTF